MEKYLTHLLYGRRGTFDSGRFEYARRTMVSSRLKYSCASVYTYIRTFAFDVVLTKMLYKGQAAWH